MRRWWNFIHGGRTPAERIAGESPARAIAPHTRAITKLGGDNMGDAAQDLEYAEMFGTSTPVRDMDGTWYVYWHEGVKYRFRSVEKANEWARKQGFKLSTAPTTKQQKG